MNISSEVSSTVESNSSDYSFFISTMVETDFPMPSAVYIISFLLSLPTNSYVIWRSVTGTGNGLAAEFFSLNLSVCEILICIEILLIFLNLKFHIFSIVCFFLDGLSTTGRPLFQCVICVERYLAVVRPVTFLKFKPLRYRVMCCVIVWVAGFSSGGVSAVLFYLSSFELYFSLLFAQFFIYIFFQLFCCLAVLRTLKQSGPGERGREREEENHMKRRAFCLILISNVAMVIIYAPYIILVFLCKIATQNNDTILCIGAILFTLAGLVQPLLFLYRVGRLPFIKCQ